MIKHLHLNTDRLVIAVEVGRAVRVKRGAMRGGRSAEPTPLKVIALDDLCAQ
jgi:hypothetical protein